jgi:hypothetical protein
MNDKPLYERMKDPSFGLDDGIRDAVVLLTQHGIETYESCEGGVGHSYPEPTVAFHDDNSKGLRALGICVQFGLPVKELQQVWQVDQDNAIFQIAWRVVFWKKVYYGRDELDTEAAYLRARTIFKAYSNDITAEQWQQVKAILSIDSVFDPEPEQPA